MTAFNPVAALALPSGALLDRRVPKALLIENGTSTPTDKRRVRDCVEEIRWLAVLKPTTVGVAEHRDATREYLEIAVLNLTLRCEARTQRLTALVHRAIPYPVLLFAWHGDTVEMSLAHKRRSHREGAKTVLDGGIVSVRLDDDVNQLLPAFCQALALQRQPGATMHALYQGWIDTVHALNAARVTGEFAFPTSTAAAAQRAAALHEYRCLEVQIAQLHAKARQEKQLPKRVAMNLEIDKLRRHLRSKGESIKSLTCRHVVCRI